MSNLDLPITVAADAAAGPPVSRLRLFARNPAGLFGGILLVLIVGVAVFGPLIYTVSPSETVGPSLLAPGDPGAPLLGTDELGRDILAGIVNGGRVTLTVGAVAAALSAAIGLVLGSLAGYYGGVVDAIVMRITEFFQVLPPILLAIVLVSMFRPSATTIVISIGVVAWPGTTRLVRAEFLRLRESEFVKASKCLGAGDLRLMLRVVLPNALPPLIVFITLMVGASMLFESGLSFLGVGDPTSVSWGSMLGNNRDKILVAWWPVVIPGLAIFFSVLSVSLAGDGLNDALNPKGQER